MKEYEYKVLTEALAKEIDELWDGGHAEALTAFGYECVNAYKEGYNKGSNKYFVLTLIGAGLGTAAAIAVRKIKGKREQIRNRRAMEFKKEHPTIIEFKPNT